MQVPAVLKKKVIRCYGPEGEAWLEKLPQLYADCINKWGLADIQVSEELSYNYVCFATSPDYGEVALKIGVPHEELLTEIAALNLYRGNGICRIYDHDLGLGAMLLERIRPGRDLTTVASSHERIKAAARLVAELPITIEHDHGLPKWSELARRTFGKLRAESSCGPQMIAIVNIAEEMIHELENSGRPQVLLHGDLNHWNILLGPGRRWKAIDPKGQRGVACMEAGRFMINELGIAAPDSPGELLDEMTEAFAEALEEPKHIIAQCAFLDMALGTSWSFEEHEKRNLSANVQECQFLLDYYCRIN